MVSSSTALASLEGDDARLLEVMDDICVNIFRSVNHNRYDDDPSVDEDRSSATFSSQLSNTTKAISRREILWHAADVSGSDTDLNTISQQYGSFINRYTDSRHQVLRLNVVYGPALPHQCNEYQREELNLTHHVLYNNVLVRHHATSSDKMCVVCGKPPVIPPLLRVVDKFVCEFCQIGLSQKRRLQEIFKWRCCECGRFMSHKQRLLHHLNLTCPICHPRDL